MHVMCMYLYPCVCISVFVLYMYMYAHSVHIILSMPLCPYIHKIMPKSYQIIA